MALPTWEILIFLYMSTYNADDLIITNGSKMGYADRASLVNVLEFVADNSLDISDDFDGTVGFNTSPGNIYACVYFPFEIDKPFDLAVISSFGQPARFLVTNMDSWEETEFETIDEVSVFIENSKEESI